MRHVWMVVVVAVAVVASGCSVGDSEAERTLPPTTATTASTTARPTTTGPTTTTTTSTPPPPPPPPTEELPTSSPPATTTPDRVLVSGPIDPPLLVEMSTGPLVHETIDLSTPEAAVETFIDLYERRDFVRMGLTLHPIARERETGLGVSGRSDFVLADFRQPAEGLPRSLLYSAAENGALVLDLAGSSVNEVPAVEGDHSDVPVAFRRTSTDGV